MEVELPKKVIDEIERVCKERRLNSKQKERLIEAVTEEYLRSIFEPGEAVGIVTAQSVSEPATQMTMRTYHVAGSAGVRVTLGLPRLIEIFDAKREPAVPMMTLHLHKKYNTKKDGEKVANKIIEKTLADFIDFISLDLTNRRIKFKLKELKKSEVENILSILKKKLKGFKITKRQTTVTVEAEGKELSIKDLQRLKKRLLDLVVAGIPGVKDATVMKEGDEWVIKTIGSNLSKIKDVKEIDILRSYSNNIHEVAKTFGIEAARNLIIRETKSTMQQQHLDVDDRHIMLIADIMTFSGSVKPIGRYGVAGAKASVLTRAAFEETIKHLIRASVRGEADDFKAIFDNVMVNQQVPVGTGMFELIARFGEEHETGKVNKSKS